MESWFQLNGGGQSVTAVHSGKNGERSWRHEVQKTHFKYYPKGKRKWRGDGRGSGVKRLELGEIIADMSADRPNRERKLIL